ncbi:MAG: hypothetical protein KAS17_04890 [Victivallaceae bacterium]|nr:hypothetical protein [Victivallaceae bacterium]
MYEEIIITCPECDTQFYAPREYCGGIVDCTECGSAFEIIALPEDNIKKADIAQPEHDDTIVISRSDIGMIPELDDVKIK